MTDREIFRNNLIALMNATKTKQVDISKYAQVSYQTVSAWVCGRGYPRADTMEKLCKFFGVKKSALTDDPEESEEDRLLSVYRLLSKEGRRKLMERANELLTLCPNRGDNDGKETSI